jgi:hypothetical protein
MLPTGRHSDHPTSVLRDIIRQHLLHMAAAAPHQRRLQPIGPPSATCLRLEAVTSKLSVSFAFLRPPSLLGEIRRPQFTAAVASELHRDATPVDSSASSRRPPPSFSTPDRSAAQASRPNTSSFPAPLRARRLSPSIHHPSAGEPLSSFRPEPPPRHCLGVR